jgi:hypothetical protein
VTLIFFQIYDFLIDTSFMCFLVDESMEKVCVIIYSCMILLLLLCCYLFYRDMVMII